MRIGLGWGLTGAQVSAPVGLLVVADGAILADIPPGQAAVVKLVSGQVQVNALAPVPGPVRLVPREVGAPNPVTFKGKPYRGEVELVVGQSGRLSVVNLVNLEEYLQGVVPNEMWHSWPAEALKAQAVAARTYAMANRSKHAKEGFDLRNTSDDQAYGGIEVERPSTNQAVQSTRGRVVTYQGKLVATYYHSSSGGHTENNEHYWTGGTPLGYLRGVPDYDDVEGNRWYAWSYQFAPEEFAQKLKQAGYGVGTVQAITPGPAGASGRPVRWSVSGSGGQVTLTMAQMRTALGIPSGSRSIQLKSEPAVPVVAQPSPPPPPQYAPVYVVGAGGTAAARQVAGSYVVGADGKLVQRPAGSVAALGATTATTVGRQIATPAPPPTPPPSPPQPVGVEVKGGGHGHAIGLSQWGAHGMALQGKSYTEILTHFYSGTKVETR